MPPRRIPSRRVSEGSTAAAISQTGQLASRTWQNPLMRNTFIGIATVVGALAIWMGFLLNPSYPVPPKGIVLITGQRRLGGLGKELKEKMSNLSSRS